MDDLTAPRIVNVDRMNDGIIVKFDDGKCAFFSCSLLYAKLPEGKELHDTELQW